MSMKNCFRQLCGLIGVAAVVLSLFQSAAASAQARSDICSQIRSNPGILDTLTAVERGVLDVECAKAAGQDETQSPVHLTYTPDFYRTREQLRARGLLPTAPSSKANMTYHNGSIMQTVTVYTIYWSPNNTLTNDYKNLINQYFTDVNGSAFYNMNTQYFQNPGPVFMQNSSSLGGTWTDTTHSGTGNGYPGGRGTATNTLTRADIENEVTAALAANPSWGPPGLTKQYMVYYEQGIEQCFNATSCTPGVTTGKPAYCAYHTFFNSGGNPVIYGNMPYDETWTTNCRTFSNSPNGNLAADAEISTSSHEHFEAATDPRLDAWYDSDTSGENGDKCAYLYGATQPDGHNMVLNGHPYIIQQEWSNADLDPTVAFSGCVKRYNADVDAAVSKTGPASAVAGTTLSYNITVANNSAAFEATDVELTDAVPANATFVSFAQTAGPAFACASPAVGATGTIDCTRLALPASASASFTLVVKVDPSAPAGASMSNIASITSTSDDTVASNNSAAVNTVITAVADLAVEKRATIDLVIPGVDATYALTITNSGPSDAQNTVLTDSIPSNSTFAALAQTAGAPLICTTPAIGSTGAISCVAATLPVGASATFTMAVHVGPLGSSAITNTAVITSSASDPDLGNNTSTVTTTVSINKYKQRALADLSALFGATSNKQDAHKLHEAIEELADSLDAKLWTGDNTLSKKKGDEVFGEERDSATILVGLIKKNSSGLTAALQPIVARLVAADRALADIAISQAAAAAGRPSKIAQAREQLARGDASAAAGKPTTAIGRYRSAWQRAQDAMAH